MTNTDTEARTGTVDLISGLLLGPLADDEVISSSPADTYMTGILWPEGETLAVIEDDQSEGATFSEDSEADTPVPGYRAIRPCSLGLTFAIDDGETLEVSLGRTARYIARQSEPEPGSGRPVRQWHRRQLGYALRIEPGPAGSWQTSRFSTPEGLVDDQSVRVHIRRRPAGNQQVFTLTLINRAVETDNAHPHEFCLFQAELVARCQGQNGDGAIRPRPVLPPAGGDEDTQSAALLYRDAVEFAVGHGIAAQWPQRGPERVEEVRTSWLPTASVKGMSAEGHPCLEPFRTAWPDALKGEWLAREGSRAEVISALRAFHGAYTDWIETSLEERVGDFTGELASAAQRNLGQCQRAASRISAGIEALEVSEAAWKAFALANAAMDRQARYAVKGERAGPLNWRPFQLAYLLLVLPGLTEQPAPEAERDCVDLLWFPTGGGKTEAYLALTAFQIFLRRLTSGERRASGGTDVLMRYTLRLLTVQQFQRAASLICACDAIRLGRNDLGEASISLGLYVGGDATPNRVEEARSALAEEHGGLAPRSTPRQLLICPVCATALPASAYSFRDDETEIDIRCPNSECETSGRALPVLTVDDFIYCAPPSLLIGTVDKFAQLPRRKDLRALFGLDGGQRPGLIIQDELHLISGPLGSMAGLYETVIDMLCTKDGTRPKVIGSTATIGQAARQVRALFDRDVLQFPPAGFEASDSFFAVRDDVGADRLYLGISSAGRSPKFALQAVTAALLEAPAALRSRMDASRLDALWTCVLYFNSLRELGGAHVLLQDDVPRQMDFLASRLGSPVRKLEREPVELSSRVPSRELPEKLDSLEVQLAESGDPFSRRPEDTVLASNMISVGVDVSRLGLMIINGQPKSTAEYIQASSRIGRKHPGLVITLYNFGRPRDVSHFEHFAGYHSALYRNVEATSVTPWAPRARDKALHAVLAAAIRHLIGGMEDDSAARDFNPEAQEVRDLVEAIAKRAASASGGVEALDTAEDLEAIVREWAQRSRDAQTSGRKLVYWERKAPFGSTLPHLMTSAEEGGRTTRLAWPTPNSMRDVEPSSAFSLKRIGER